MVQAAQVYEAQTPAGIQAALQRALDDLERDFMEIDYTDTLVKFETVLEDAHAASFAAQTTPGGEPLAPLAPSTIKRKGHSHILVDKGPLRESLAGRTGDSIRDIIHIDGQTVMSFGTDVPYAIFHTTGTKRMPKREHVGMSEATVDTLCEMVAADTIKKLKG